MSPRTNGHPVRPTVTLRAQPASTRSSGALETVNGRSGVRPGLRRGSAPDLLEDPQGVAADDQADLVVRPVVGDQPADDVAEALRRVLDPVHVLDPWEPEVAARLGDRQVLGERLVQADVVAEQRVRAEGHVLDADHVDAVAEVVHHRVQVMARVRGRQRGVGRGLDADDPAAFGARRDHPVRLHPPRVPDGPRAGVGDQHRRAAGLDRVQAGLVAGVGHVDGDAEPVHPLDRALPESRQTAVAPLPQARAERVRLAVGDAHLPHPQAVEHVDAVDLVLDRGGGLQPHHQREPAGLVREADVGHRLGAENEVLMGDVAEPVAEVVDGVVPLPAGLAGDARGAVHEVVEHRGQARAGQPLVPGAVPPGADQVEGLGDVVGEDRGVLVQRDDDAVGEQAAGALALGVAELEPVAGHPADLRRELELLVVPPGLQVLERLVAGVARRRWLHLASCVRRFGSRSAPIVTDHGRVSRLASRARRGGGGMGLERIGEAVRQRRVSAVELVRQSLERIERLDGELGAVVALRAERALEEAAALDRRAAGGAPLGPLAGAPLLVKDIEDVEGMPTTFGSLLFKDAPPASADGLVTGRLRAAGAIVVGKTNLPEFAAQGYTTNSLFGVTRNPWALRWSPGGSSGGSGAALAAGMVPLATATDGGGSIRIPATLCGLAGIKPSGGLIGRRPIPDWIDLSTDGPLATSVEDLRLLLALEAGPVADDPTALPVPPALERGERPARPGRGLAAPRFVPWGPLPADVAELFDAALLALERDLGLAIEPVEPERIFRAGNLD